MSAVCRKTKEVSLVPLAFRGRHNSDNREEDVDEGMQSPLSPSAVMGIKLPIFSLEKKLSCKAEESCLLSTNRRTDAGRSKTSIPQGSELID